jgi:hypothetical protein
MRTEASSEKPPPWCQPAMSCASAGSSGPARANQRNTRARTCCCTAARSSGVSAAASAKWTCPSAPTANTPSITQQWKWTAQQDFTGSSGRRGGSSENQEKQYRPDSALTIESHARSGLLHRRPGNRAKSPSVECSRSPCSIASAARCASGTRFARTPGSASRLARIST